MSFLLLRWVNLRSRNFLSQVMKKCKNLLSSKLNKYALNSIAMLILGIVQRFAGFITIFVLSRALTPDELGRYAFTQSTAQSATGLGRFGIIQGLQVRIAEEAPYKNLSSVQRKLGEVLSFILIVGGLSVLAIILGAPWLAWAVYGSSELAPNVILAAFMFLGLLVARFVYAVLAGMDLFSRFSRWMSIASLLAVIFILFGLFVHGVTGAIFGLVFGQLILSLWLYKKLNILLYRENILLRLYWPGRETVSALRIGAPFYLAGVFMIPVQFYIVGLVAQLDGVDALGDLRVILTIIGLAQLLPEALNGPLISHFTLESKNNNGAILGKVISHFRLLWCIALIIGFSLATVWPVFSEFIFGEQYVRAGTLGPLSILPFVPTLLSAPITSAILAGQRTFGLIFVGGLQASILLCVGIILIPRAGMSGFFVAQFIASVIALIAWLFIFKHQQKASLWNRWVFTMYLLSFVLCSILAVDQVIHVGRQCRLILGSVLVIATSVVVWVSVLNDIERRSIVGLLPKF